ncbi:MAG TPA: UDP-N-acetylmuramoyl-L-alanyl-D-glutamate--2,6-diaminopimelate ligase [Gaiellales bacterium]|nr:UDP-N-acetylmuramoyl-L-alanyl-D-glutamate--2,6-diaminopimelate ligase [Gaiellales bacterium]
MKLAALCMDAGVASRVIVSDVDVVDIAYRSERCGPGSLFCCLPGATVDGHDFAPAAVANGAVALLVERELPALDVPQIVCDDARAGMALLADTLYEHPSGELGVVGVTGTNGKTTTTLLLAAILDAAQRPCGLLGTVERRIGGRREAAGLTTPEAPDLQRALRSMIDAGDEACVMEASSIAIVQRRLVATQFAAVGFTNLSQDHLDFHRDLEDYFAAKASLFDGRFPRAVNADDAYGARLGAELRFGVETVTADVHCEAFELRPDRTELFVRTPQGALSLEPRLRGRFNVDNVLCAVTLALLMEVPLGAIEHAVAATGAPPGRFEPVEGGAGFGVIVDYAHTPAGIAAVLASARPLASGRLLCVFGAGGDRDQAKRPMMGAAAETGADRLYVTSDNPRSESNELIAGQILAGLQRAADALVEHDRRRAIARALEDAEPGDLVLILGKGHEQGQDIGGVVEPFDDRSVALQLLGGGE